MPAFQPIADRFAAKTERDPITNCLNWTGAKTHGYGVLGAGGHGVVRAHRWALEQKLGRPLRPGMFACHTCDNRGCVEAEHLYEGTRRENVDDATTRGRVAWGVRNSFTRLSPNEVRRIRNFAAQGFTQEHIAEVVGVHQSTVSRIVSHRRWSRLDSEAVRRAG